MFNLRMSLSFHRLDGAFSTASMRVLMIEEGSLGNPVGWHRLQGRYPANIASCAVSKNSQFSILGLRALQVGRQKIPVLRMAAKKMPS